MHKQKEFQNLSSDAVENIRSPLPARVDRRRGAELITEKFFPISARTLEVWPVTWRHVNGRATCDTHELLAVAKEKLEAAPAIAGGKKRSCRGILINDQTQ